MHGKAPGWDQARSRLRQMEPGFEELEPGGALVLVLDDEDWILEIAPDGRIICQTGMDMEDVKSLLSDNTPEDLGTDELAKQAKYYIQPAVSKRRQTFLGAGFEETTEMTEDHVAVLFHRPLDFQKMEEVEQAIRWCRGVFKAS